MAQAAIIAAPAAPASSREETRTGALRHAARMARRLLRTAGAAGEPHLARGFAHRLVAIARGQTQALDDAAHDVGKAMREAEAVEPGPGVIVDERPALAGLRDIGMEQQRSRPRSRRPSPRCDAISSDLRDGVAHVGHQIRGERQGPVDVERRRHVRLHLRDHARRPAASSCSRCAPHSDKRFARRAGAHMHACRADDRAARRRRLRCRMPAPSAVQTTST